MSWVFEVLFHKAAQHIGPLGGEGVYPSTNGQLLNCTSTTYTAIKARTCIPFHPIQDRMHFTLAA